jgi:small subunit ribosomal protein S8
MSMQDLISDFVARINNAIMVEKETVEVLRNNLVVEICKKLTTQGYFNGFKESEDGRTVVVNLNLANLKKLVRVSKPGRRVYVSYENLPKIMNGKGVNLISTSGGVMVSKESKQHKMGGELLMQVVGF